MDWVDERNYGVSHFGVFPVEYNINNLRYDIFHGRGNVVKCILKNIRKLLSNNYLGISKFGKALANLPGWGITQIEPWVFSSNVSVLKGKHTKLFTCNIHYIVESLKDILPEYLTNDLCDALKTFEKMSKIISLIIIDKFENVKEFFDDDENLAINISKTHIKQEIADAFITKYKKLSEDFYLFGMKSFMTDLCVGDRETFYMHALRWYFPRIMQETYNKHDLGIGIFSMEGFENKNSKSKTALRRYSNHRGNLCSQSLTSLTMSFIHANHDVKKDSHKRSLERNRNKYQMNKKSKCSSVSSIGSISSIDPLGEEVTEENFFDNDEDKNNSILV